MNMGMQSEGSSSACSCAYLNKTCVVLVQPGDFISARLKIDALRRPMMRYPHAPEFLVESDNQYGCPNLHFHLRPIRGVERAPLDDCRPALRRLANQLSRSRGDFVCAAFDFPRPASDAGDEGTAALFFLLVIRAGADSDRVGQRPLQFVLVVRGRFHGLVDCTGRDRTRDQPRHADLLSHHSGNWRIDLSSRWNEDRQPAV